MVLFEKIASPNGQVLIKPMTRCKKLARISPTELTVSSMVTNGISNCFSSGWECAVVGVPKTIDNDINLLDCRAGAGGWLRLL